MKKALVILAGFYCISATMVLEGETKLKIKDRKTYDLAEFHFAAEEFVLSEKYFADLAKNYPKDGYFRMQQGYSLFELDQFSSSIECFGKAIELKMDEAHYYKARAHHRMEHFKDALFHYQEYSKVKKRSVTDARLQEEINSVLRAKEAYDYPLDVRIKNIGDVINTVYEDYVPLVSPDGNRMVFTSKRPGGMGDDIKFDDTLYEDIFVSDRIEGNWTEPVRLNDPVNSAMHDANVCFSADGESLILYRNDKNKNSGDLYMAQFVDGAGESLLSFQET